MGRKILQVGQPNEGNQNNQRKGSFWTSFPGILTGIASIVAAFGTVGGLALSHQSDGNQSAATQSAATQSAPTQATQPWEEQANSICATAIQNGSGYVAADPLNDQLSAAARFANNFQSVDDQLRNLPVSSKYQATVSAIITFWDDAVIALRIAIQDTEAGNFTGEQKALTVFNTANTDGNNLANGLGADTCASGSF
jgi:hypothetical protein